MPQLKKVVLAVGNRLIYSDTYEQALALINSGTQTNAPVTPVQPALVSGTTPLTAKYRPEARTAAGALAQIPRIELTRQAGGSGAGT